MGVFITNELGVLCRTKACDALLQVLPTLLCAIDPTGVLPNKALTCDNAKALTQVAVKASQPEPPVDETGTTSNTIAGTISASSPMNGTQSPIPLNTIPSGQLNASNTGSPIAPMQSSHSEATAISMIALALLTSR
ncbi:Aste57867_15167 [Aphanomyces stellatus]|uniref:Aste57867_15167 protein n=1 Tax=Aphanomyces stellatus TaxID=120398 RepID=A0A485L2J7_9STRA|nr:hypothetical protein As57867_015111 [Aphanomyces stellatus]VFT91976.1 Aste57867_15167 [Aphanomyces stellatus]